MLVASCVVITTTSGRSGVAAVGFAETGKRIFQMLDAVQDLGCDEACKYIKSRVLRAYEVGMMLFDACGAESGDESCVKNSEVMCECEKKAGRAMCSELEYAWSTLCPDTKTLAMHQGVCEGQTISETRDMCKKTELLPGVIVDHFPLGSQGLKKIDDNWKATPPVEVEEGGDADEGGVASGYMASS